MKALNTLAGDAISVQDACNLMGVVNGFSRAMTDLREVLTQAKMPTDTNAINNHPICRLWASKIHDLTGMGFSDSVSYAEAYDTCRKLRDSE